MNPTRALPMFPLGTVLFPHAPLPLHVFEPRYRTMVRDLLDGDGEFGVVLIERGHEVGGGDVRFSVGTLARLLQCSPLPDGRYALMAYGTVRLRVEEWLPDDPYPQAAVTVLDDPDVAGDLAPALTRAVDALDTVLTLAAELDPRFTPPDTPPLSPDASTAAFELCARAPLGPLDAQRLLEATDTATRLGALHAHLDDLAAMLRTRLDGR